jgi:hypothetical protein
MTADPAGVTAHTADTSALSHFMKAFGHPGSLRLVAIPGSPLNIPPLCLYKFTLASSPWRPLRVTFDSSSISMVAAVSVLVSLWLLLSVLGVATSNC